MAIRVGSMSEGLGRRARRNCEKCGGGILRQERDADGKRIWRCANCDDVTPVQKRTPSQERQAAKDAKRERIARTMRRLMGEPTEGAVRALLRRLEEAALDPIELGERAFWARIDAAPGDRYITTREVDWGRRPRGQGKRRGGMVMGGMSDAPQGRKSYNNLLGAAPLSAKERDEAALLDTVQQVLIARALAAGFSADVAMIVAYTAGTRPISREEAYAFICERT